MPQFLENLKLREISLVDRPANSTTDKSGKKTPRATVALFKRDDDGADGVDKSAEGIKFVIGFPKAGGGSRVQSVVFDKAMWDAEKAKKWLGDHDMKSPKIDETDNTIRFRQEDPDKFDKFRVIQPGEAKKTDIPASAQEGVKANTSNSKGDENMPMTLDQLEKALIDTQGVVNALKADKDALQNENALVIKMSKNERKCYASMSDTARKEYMAGNTNKRVALMEDAQKARKQKKLVDSMDATLKSAYEAAGPVEKAAMLEAQEEALEEQRKREEEDANRGVNKKDKKEKKAASSNTDDEEEADDEGDEECDDEDDKKKRDATLTPEVTALKQELAKANDRINKSETQLVEIGKRERLASFVKRAEDLMPHTPGKPEEKGMRLMKLAEAFGESSEEYKAQCDFFQKADRVYALQYSEVGKAGDGAGIPALSRFDAKVEEISKRDKIDKGHATVKAMDESPELYLDYERERKLVARA